MPSIPLILLVAASVTLAGMLLFRLVRWTVRRLRRPPQVPTLMRVAEITPEQMARVQAARAASASTSPNEPVQRAEVQAPGEHSSRWQPPHHHSPQSATTMFRVEQLRERSLDPLALETVDPADTPLADGSDYSFGPSLTPFLAAALPDSSQRKSELKTELIRAGYYQPHAYENIQALRWVFLILPLFLLCVVINVIPRGIELWAIGVMLGLAVLGWALPKLYVAGQARDRRTEIERSLPDVLDMLNMCVSQGMTVIAALKRVTRELRSVYPALSQELQIVAEQAELGTLEQALTNLARRVDAPDVHSFTSLLIQTERMGTSVSVALGDYAENMRESLRQRADEKANKATFQLLFPTVLFLMPAVYIFLLGPSIIKLTDFFAGRNNPYQQAEATFRNATDGIPVRIAQ